MWDAKNVNAGIYYYQVKTNGGNAVTNKLVKM